MKTVSPDGASPSRFLTISNILSISRALLSIPFVLVMLAQAPWSRLWGAVILALAALTDNLDGRIARRYHQETEWGRILDPLADKVGLAAAGLVFLHLGLIPLWFVAALLARDLIIFLGGVYVKARKGIVLPSNVVGKWSVGIICATLLAILVDAPVLLITILIWTSAGMLMLSLGLYVRRFIEVVGRRGE